MVYSGRSVRTRRFPIINEYARWIDYHRRAGLYISSDNRTHSNYRPAANFPRGFFRAWLDYGAGTDIDVVRDHDSPITHYVRSKGYVLAD